MGNFIRLVATLTVIAAVASFGLSAVYNATHEITEQYALQEKESARREVLPGAEDAHFVAVETDSIVDGEPFVYFTAYESEGSDEIVGRTFTAYGKGYSSTIETIVGVDPAGEISGIKITYQQETPGLGAKITEVSSQNTLWDVIGGRAKDESEVRPWFQAQFRGKSLDDLTVVKTSGEEGILAVTGATISSEAVTGSVQRGLAMLLSIVRNEAAASESERAGSKEGETSSGDAAPGDAVSGEQGEEVTR